MSSKNRITNLAGWSIAVAGLVLILKTLAWWITGSVALFSDALESVINVVTASLAWLAIRISHVPADKRHPFGHYKAEYFSAVVAGVLIVVAALLIFTEAVSALANPHALNEPASGMAVNGLAAVINGLWAWRLIREGRRSRSPALSADGRHIMVDVVTSAGVIVGLGLVLATGWLFLDSLIAIGIGINVLLEGWKVIRSSVDGLMDSALDETETERIRQTILASATGALEVHDIKTRSAGHVSFIEFHLVVDGRMSVADSHAICNRVEAALAEAIPGSNITIHVEPDEESKRDGLTIG
ncbi:cation diffusion facilitator family transporter [Nitratireductor sp. XY-223]|uniref:cation diffusion facilitator family transporter n=1 Tax=Nitratireductor sp. XY-223 TaxID=2561926 RepID=UPI0010AA5550|nr:cation diffusion facilitator family transporter [Nitratireductor sp. XY-223]